MRPVAKAKRRAAERDADIDALKKANDMLQTVKGEGVQKKARNEVPTADVVGIMADEIQLIYEDAGSRLDEVNARDKALTLWRALSFDGVHAREREVPHVLCEEHS